MDVMKRIEKRLSHFTCINAQDIDEVIEENKDELNEEHGGEPVPTKVRRHLPPATGPYSVGCVDVLNSSSEDGTFFRLFYPVKKTDILTRDTQWPLWLPRKQYGFGYAHFLRRNPPKLFGKFFNWLGGDAYIPALWQAPLLESDSQFPVVIMSHGIGGNRTTYTTYCCELAANGFIVAVPEHRDGSASMTFLLKDSCKRNTVELIKDGSGGKHKRHAVHRSQSFKEEWRSFEHTEPMGIPWDDFKYRNKQVHQRAEECSRLLDLLTDINHGRSIRNFLGFHFSLKQFKGRMDMSRVSFAGHSFGGSTCAAALARDPRFRVGLMLDAWMHPLEEDICKRITQPVLMLNFETFQWKKNIQEMSWMEREGTDRTMLTIKGACHQAVSDFQFLCSKTFGKLMEVRSELSPKTAMELNKRASLSFLAKHLELNDLQVEEDILLAKHEHLVLGTTMNMISKLTPF